MQHTGFIGASALVHITNTVYTKMCVQLYITGIQVEFHVILDVWCPSAIVVPTLTMHFRGMRFY